MLVDFKSSNKGAGKQCKHLKLTSAIQLTDYLNLTKKHLTKALFPTGQYKTQTADRVQNADYVGKKCRLPTEYKMQTDKGLSRNFFVHQKP